MSNSQIPTLIDIRKKKKFLLINLFVDSISFFSACGFRDENRQEGSISVEKRKIVLSRFALHLMDVKNVFEIFSLTSEFAWTKNNF